MSDGVSPTGSCQCAGMAMAAGVPRLAYFGLQLGWLETPVLRRAALSTPCQGPCIVEEYDATCVVPPKAMLDAYGDIIIDLP